MIRNVGELRAALESYPDDTEVKIYSFPFGGFRPLDFYHHLNDSLVVDGFEYPDDQYTPEFAAYQRAEETKGIHD